ncbi:MAG: hypothetical protein K5780_06750 [Alphaproteobacteria bacterium]|nr:hypothetical protein [Alphaproteobacteria bacterium]
MNNESIIKTFRESNSAKSEKLTGSFIEKNDRLKLLKKEALEAIKSAKIANDNRIKEKN